MSKKKLKVTWEPEPLTEAHTIGYMEGISDGRITLLNQLEKFGLLRKDWKSKYNKNMKEEGYMVK